MKYCVTCVYWMLLVISVVSSGLLFLIVASESTQAKDHIFPPEKNGIYKYDNTTLDAVGDGGIELVNEVAGEIQGTENSDGKGENQFRQDEATMVSASFETFASEEGQKEKDLEVLRESITQQPNLSQGISETGQAVVLTLVDTAAAELHSLAKQPKLNQDFRGSRSTARNSSLSSSSPSPADGSPEQPELPQEVLPTTQIAPPPIVDETTEKPNDTDPLEDEDVLLHRKIPEEAPDVVVVVRAEQKVTNDDPRLDEETVPGQVLPDEVTKVEDTFTTAPELNDTAARAQLVSGSRDEGAGVILDGLVTGGPSDPHEDIPSFSEWAQKRLEEAEKKKTHPNASVQNPGGGTPARGAGGMKVRSKNYASPDCGAKVVAANPEARSARSVLVSTRDEYMLNTCTSRVWFVVELCEAIQAKKIELANFELFSSSPKDFSVYVSDRFSTRDWSPVGQFTAKDVKDIQSFALHPHLFGKFIKVELHSHYGSEHFCPVSLFRAYGTSEFEVLETETENQAAREVASDAEDDDDNDEEELDGEGEAPRNLFGSARDAVLSIVKKAAEVLVKSSDLTGNNITEIQQSIDGGNILENSYDTCTTPRYTILCGNCSDQKFAKVFQLVSCRDRQLDDLLRIEFVNRTLRQGGLCGIHGVEIDTVKKKDNATEEERRTGGELKNLQATFLASVFKPEYIVALCNVLATRERKVVMNTSYEIPGNNSEDTTKREDILSAKASDESETGSRQTTAPCTVDSSSPCKSPGKEIKRRSQEFLAEEVEETTATTIIETSSSTETLASQIKPTKTLSKEDLKKESSAPILEPSKELTERTLHAEVITTVPPATNLATPTLKIVEEPSIIGTSLETAPQTVTSAPVTTADSQEASEILGSDMEGLEMVAGGKVEKEEEGSKQKELEQEKLSSQDHAMFDTLLSDLKDLEGDGNLPNGPAASVSSTAQPAASSTPQKESVFLRLSNRIKALERNMSLSGQYLEELSRRYKKQVEEMQRSLERAVSAMGEESRRGEERETKRLEEIAALREEIAVLSKSVESLLHDRDSWRSKFSAVGQHALLICLEVVIVIRVLSYWRRASLDDGARAESTKGQTVRRKSAENYNSHVAAKKTKRRRPSEIASHITGTYHELMIEDKSQESKKERKKKRKKELALNSKLSISSETKRETVRYKTVLNVIPGGTSLPSRRASSIDAPNITDLQPQETRRPESAPEASVGWFDEQIERKERVVALEDKDFERCSERSSDLSRQMDELSESNSSTNMDRTEGSIEPKSDSAKNSRSGILKGARLSSPSFMKTALGSRRKRKMSNEKWEWESRGDSGEKSPQISPTSLKALSETVNGNTANGLLDDSDESRSSSATPTSGKKEKKSTGLKKMVRKLF